MKQSRSIGWKTYAAIVFGKLEPTPGAPMSIQDVERLVSMKRAEKRPLKDGNLQVYQFRMKEASHASF